MIPAHTGCASASAYEGGLQVFPATARRSKKGMVIVRLLLIQASGEFVHDAQRQKQAQGV